MSEDSHDSNNVAAFYRPARFSPVSKSEWDAQVDAEFKDNDPMRHYTVGDSIRNHGLTPVSLEADYKVSEEIAAQCRAELAYGARCGWRRS